MSAQVVNDYATQRSLPILDALVELDHLCYDDWLRTLPDAPTGHVRKTQQKHDEAIAVFCRNRKAWVKEAIAIGLNLQGFTLAL